ncbi:hypothetical protein ACQP3L_34465, partial [Escherichia coli]
IITRVHVLLSSSQSPSKIQHIQSHKASPKSFKRVQTVSYVLPNYTGMKYKMKSKRNYTTT